MTRRTRTWLVGGAAVLALLLILFQDELGILVANQRPDDEAARLVEALAVVNGDTVAEIGAGRGRLTVAMATALPASRIYSTELDPDRLADIRRAVERASLGNVDVREAALEETNLPDGCCDAIFMRTVYHHFTSPPAMIAALHRGLKPGGRLAIIEFEPRGIWTSLAVPHDTPARGGHGVPIDMLRREVTRDGLFRHTRTVDRWAGRLYLMIFDRGQTGVRVATRLDSAP
ncbi:MAG: class I SAM-dependent methyltransferase [Vicinamibacterales bacterium]